eukprot:sb/3469582/
MQVQDKPGNDRFLHRGTRGKFFWVPTTTRTALVPEQPSNNPDPALTPPLTQRFLTDFWCGAQFTLEYSVSSRRHCDDLCPYLTPDTGHPDLRTLKNVRSTSTSDRRTSSSYLANLYYKLKMNVVEVVVVRSAVSKRPIGERCVTRTGIRQRFSKRPTAPSLRISKTSCDGIVSHWGTWYTRQFLHTRALQTRHFDWGVVIYVAIGTPSIQTVLSDLLLSDHINPIS